MRPIQREFWLSLREAAKLVGRAACGEKWSDELLDKPNDPRHQATRKDLYSIFKSGDVPALFDDGTDLIEAKPAHVLHYAFYLDIPGNQVTLGQIPGHPFTALLHRETLEKFLRRTHAFRSAAAHKTDLEAECTAWLVGEMNKSPQRPDGRVRKDYWEEARERFPGISERAFGRAWNAAIKETGAVGWRAGGRPKRSHKTETPAAP